MAFNYVNPSADQYVSANFDFFRLKQALVSAGDIFEVPQGGHVFALGPDSDISLATIAYVDPLSQSPFSTQATTVQTMMSTFTISPQRPWVAHVPAVNKEGNYVPSNVPGRVLIWPTEIYDATWRPDGFEAEFNGLVFEPPVIDIIQHFASPSVLVPQRTDKTYYYDQLPFLKSEGGEIDNTNVLIPYYGRRYASITVDNKAETPSLEMRVFGVCFRITEGQQREFLLLELRAIAPFYGGVINTARSVVIGTGYNTLAYNVNDVQVADAALQDNAHYQAGLFDYLYIELVATEEGDADASLRVVVSDVVGRTSA